LEFDHNVYINTHEGVIIIMHIDDLFIFAQDAKIFHQLKDILCSRFSMTNLRETKFILGLQVTKDRSQRNIMLGQLNYIKGVLIKFNACKPITTPLDLGAKLSKNQSPSSTKRRM
jgi:hypothetical protein